MVISGDSFQSTTPSRLKSPNTLNVRKRRTPTDQSIMWPKSGQVRPAQRFRRQWRGAPGSRCFVLTRKNLQLQQTINTVIPFASWRCIPAAAGTLKSFGKLYRIPTSRRRKCKITGSSRVSGRWLYKTVLPGGSAPGVPEDTESGMPLSDE